MQPTVLLHSWFAVVASGKPLLWNLAPLRRGFFVRGRNENPSRVVLQPYVGHGLFQPVRVFPALCNRLCGIVSMGLPGVASRQAPSERPLSLAPRRGFCLATPAPSAGSLLMPVG